MWDARVEEVGLKLPEEVEVGEPDPGALRPVSTSHPEPEAVYVTPVVPEDRTKTEAGRPDRSWTVHVVQPPVIRTGVARPSRRPSTRPPPERPPGSNRCTREVVSPLPEKRPPPSSPGLFSTRVAGPNGPVALSSPITWSFGRHSHVFLENVYVHSGWMSQGVGDGVLISLFRVPGYTG